MTTSLSTDDNLLATQLGQMLTPAGDFSKYQVVRRSGDVVEFNPSKITVAITKAYIAIHGSNSVASHSVRDQISGLTDMVVGALQSRRPSGGSIFIEDIQDQVELALMRKGEYEVARSYVLYREERSRERALDGVSLPKQKINVAYKDGSKKELNASHLMDVVTKACTGLAATSAKAILDEALRNVYDGVTEDELYKSIILASRQLIEVEPEYNFVTARILMHTIAQEVMGKEVDVNNMDKAYRDYFAGYIEEGIKAELLNPELAKFDLAKLADNLVAKRDNQFKYLGLQTLYDRYFLHISGRRIEMPQSFFMRVSMGLALNEDNREERAIEFYNLLSSFDFMSSTPTLFNSGTLHSQLSSCYLTTVADDLAGIYDALKENALLSKYAGGLGNDFSQVRAMGAVIKGTNGKSQGVIPFLKVVNDTAVAVNQGGKRKGAVCTYLETWHADIEEFLELRKNTGDDRRRCHDMNTANWIPDLFMQRVHEQAQWTLFSPNEVPDLHDKFGKEFTIAYEKYEKLADEGKIKVAKRVPALQIWRKILTMLFETGHPWVTFKDPCNIRSPQQHAGVVHSSNLCTEITLNTNEREIAVCNLGSVNLPNHIIDGKVNAAKLQQTIKTAMRMLDNVIDINFYPVEKARNSNLAHRPVGMGFMGFQDCLHMLRIPYASVQAVEFADRSMEMMAYYAYYASSQLASERGKYSTYDGSLWSKGILPLDSLKTLAKERGEKYLEVNMESRLDWEALRAHIKQHGMRNSNCLAIAPTATIANIIGVSASIEPTYQNIFVKSNLSGEFTVVNEFLVKDLKAKGLWDEVMLADIKYFDGSLQRIERITDDLKELYATAFEMDPRWLVEAGSRRQKWIDQAQSLNLYVSQPSGRKLDELYRFAWIRGLKTTYYLRTLAATSAEKSTGRGGELNAVDADGSTGAFGTAQQRSTAAMETEPATDVKFCSIDNPDCESCQ
ncbi:MAG: ribonucleoside-diphosphate reductase subunit alpha [Burkholderiales bacterium]|jgi:ribonucleoside-diphosphate reductase alpha chain|nr:ribonucleoside-diphosphate reductase subunit alpha [Burkholderiales bacterium]